MTVDESNLQDLGDLVVRLAKGEVALGDLAGIDTKDKVKILQYGIAQLQTGRSDDAIRILEGLVALDHRTPLFQEYLGFAYERSGRLDDALRAYDNNIVGLSANGESGERMLEAHMLRARIHLHRGDKTSAVEDITEARRHDSGKDPALTKELALLERAAGGAA